MIVGTSYSPAKAFINFAHQFLEALSENDYGKALSKLDMTQKKWTKDILKKKIEEITSGKGISSPLGIKKSASPEIDSKQDNNIYILKHKVSSEGKWLNSNVLFKFERVKGEYFKITFNGFEP